MAKVIDRNVNANDTAEISAGITLNISTSVKIADANEDRIYFSAECNAETASAWLKLQAATVDNNDGDSIWIMTFGTRFGMFSLPDDVEAVGTPYSGTNGIFHYIGSCGDTTCADVES